MSHKPKHPARVIAECKDLHSALQRTGVAIKRSALPILSQVHFTAEDDTLTLRAGFDSTSVVTHTKAEVNIPGEFTLPWHQASRLLGHLSGSVGIAVEENNRVKVTCGKSKQNLLTFPPEDYPALPVIEDDAYSFSIEAETLSEALNAVAFAVGTDAIRPLRQQSVIPAKEIRGRPRKTDTHRCALRQIGDFLPSGAQNTQRILSAQGVADLLSLLKGAKNVCVRISDRRIQFDLSDEGTTSVILRLIEGNYPNYKRIIPDEFAADITLPVAPTLAALKRLELCTDSSIHRTTWKLSGDTLLISAESAELGAAEEEIDVTVSGGSVGYVFGINVRYMQEALAAVPTEFARLRCPISNLKPFLLEPVAGIRDRLVVLMPLQVI